MMRTNQSLAPNSFNSLVVRAPSKPIAATVALWAALAVCAVFIPFGLKASNASAPVAA